MKENIKDDIIDNLSVFNIANTDFSEDQNRVTVYIQGRSVRYTLTFDISQQTVGILEGSAQPQYYGFDIDNLKPVVQHLLDCEYRLESEFGELPFHHPMSKLVPIDQEGTTEISRPVLPYEQQEHKK